MTIKGLLTFSAALEFGTGLALIIAPSLVAHVLLNTDLSSSGVAVGRLAGLGLLSLGLSCRPGKGGPSPQSVRALITYNLLAALYLGYLRTGGGFVSYLLWPACALHGLLVCLMARATWAGIHQERP